MRPEGAMRSNRIDKKCSHWKNGHRVPVGSIRWCPWASWSVPSTETKEGANCLSGRSQRPLEEHLSPGWPRNLLGGCSALAITASGLVEVSTRLLQSFSWSHQSCFIDLVQILIKVISVCTRSGHPEIQCLLVSWAYRIQEALKRCWATHLPAAMEVWVHSNSFLCRTGSEYISLPRRWLANRTPLRHWRNGPSVCLSYDNILCMIQKGFSECPCLCKLRINIF